MVGEVLAAEAVDVLGVEGAVGVQALAVEQVHLVPGLPLDGDFRPAAGVLPQVVDAGEDLLGLQGVDDPDGGDLHGLEHPAGGAAHKGLLPGGIVEAGAVPAGLLQAGIPHLAAAHVVEGDGAGGGAPAGAGDQGLPLPALILQVQLGQELGVVAPGGLLVVPGGGGVVIPAVAQHDPQGVVPLPEQGGHVVGVVLHRGVEPGEGRGEHVLRHRLAVDRGHAVAQGAQGQAGGSKARLYREGQAEQWRRLVRLGGGDPFRGLEHKNSSYLQGVSPWLAWQNWRTAFWCPPCRRRSPAGCRWPWGWR